MIALTYPDRYFALSICAPGDGTDIVLSQF